MGDSQTIGKHLSALREKLLNPSETRALKLLAPCKHLAIGGDALVQMLFEQTVLRHIAIGVLRKRAPQVGTFDEEIQLL